MKDKTIVFILLGICLITIFGLFFYNYYMGDYIIQRQWISSFNEKSGTKYCDNCLWIEFYEGCNRYLIYYFENQFIEDDRLLVGDIVNIDWYNCGENKCIKNIRLAKKYRSKC